MKNALRLLLTVLLIGALVAGCSFGESEPEPEPEPESEPVEETADEEDEVDEEPPEPLTLHIGHQHPALRDGDEVPEDTALAQIAEMFMNEYPHITIEWFGARGPVQVLTSRIAAQEPTDVVTSFLVPELAARGYIYPMDEFMDGDGEFASYGLREDLTNKLEGYTFGMPEGRAPFFVITNEELRDELGIPSPQPDWTWSDFEAMAAAATNPAQNIFGISPHRTWWVQLTPMFPVWLGSAANYYGLNDDLSHSAADGSNPNVLDHLNTVTSWQDEGWMMTEQDMRDMGEDVQRPAPRIWANFQFVFDSWTLGGYNLLANQGHDVAVHPLPISVTGERKNVAFGHSWSIVSASEHKEAAWQWIKFQYSPEVIRLRAEEGAIPLTPDEEALASFRDVWMERGVDDPDFLAEELNHSVSELRNTIFGGTNLDGVFSVDLTEPGVGGLYDIFWGRETNVYEYFPPRVQQWNETQAERVEEAKEDLIRPE